MNLEAIESKIVKPLLAYHFHYLDDDYLNYTSAMIEDECASIPDFKNMKCNIGSIIKCFKRSMSDEMVDEICLEIFQALSEKRDKFCTNMNLKLLDKPVLVCQIEKQSVPSQKNVLSTLSDLKCIKQEKRRKQRAFNASSVLNALPVVSQRNNRKNADTEQSYTGQLHFNSFDISFSNLILLEDASFHLTTGRRYGLIGKNGLGKSTLLKMISSRNLVLPSNLSIYHVEQEIAGDDTNVIDAVLRSDVDRQRLLDELAEIQNRGESNENTLRLCEIMEQLNLMESDKAPARAAYILNGLGFSAEKQNRPTKEFSGGWRMRVSLAQALFTKPQLLLLDEPSNMLDMRAILWLEDYLCTWTGMIIIVSHDKEFIDTVCTDILHLMNKKLIQFNGNYDKYISSMTEKRKAQQREYDAMVEKRQHIQAFIDKFRYNAKRASLVQSRIKSLNSMPVLEAPERETGLKFRFPETDQMMGNLIQLVEVSFGYSKEAPLLKDVNVAITSGSRICMVGPNGAGKTTILKLLMGLLDPSCGERIANRKLRVAYFTQHHVDQLNLGVSALNFLHDSHPGKPAEEYRRILGAFGLSGDPALRPISVLSGGQKSRVAFANMAITNPNVVVMDEPTNHLDSESIDALCDALKYFKGAAILVLHDERMIRHCCNELWLCDNGTIKSLNGGINEYKQIVKLEIENLK